MAEMRGQRKLGRRPPKNAPALRLGPLLTGIVPVHPASEDYLARLSNWQMLGNDQYGDCVAVTWANVRRLVTSALGSAESYPGMDEVIAVYKTQNPGFPAQDDGMVIQTLLEDLNKSGGPDGVKAVAFARVDVSDLEEVKAAIAIFGSVWTGIGVLAANEDEFDAGQPWDYDPASPNLGGHSVIAGGYLGQSTDDVRFVTWAEETGFTDRFWQNLVDEAWVVIWPEHLGTTAFQQGIDASALAAAYQAITGRPLPVPITPPTPSPTPTPVPSVDEADRILAAATLEWSLARHNGSNRRAAKAVTAWRTTKGL